MCFFLYVSTELVTEAVADAAEVRTAFLLGAGEPEKAKTSAYKAIFLGLFTAVFITSLLFIGGEDIPTWLTTDPTLQRLTADLLPLFGLGNIALTIGTMSWTIVGAQGRYRLATGVGFGGSWLLSIPLAAVLSVYWKFDLRGQTAAIVVGYMVSGTINSYVLLQSDWPKLSRRVIAMAKEAGDDLDDDDDDSDDPSSSSSSNNDENNNNNNNKNANKKQPVPTVVDQTNSSPTTTTIESNPFGIEVATTIENLTRSFHNVFSSAGHPAENEGTHNTSKRSSNV
jgi:MatE